MKRAKAGVEIILCSVAGLLFGGVFFRQIIVSRFDLLLGDVGDARFNGVILEHWWQVLQGAAQWLSPAFFFPVQGVLGYSDAGFLNVLPYVVLRFMGVDSFASYQIVLFVLVAVGWIGTILFLRCCLNVSIFPAIVGAALFVFPNSMAIAASMHTQLLAVYYLPYLAIGLYAFLQNFKKRNSIGVVAGIFVAILVPAIFYTSYYVGWFSFFFILLLSCIACGWTMMHADGTAVSLWIGGKRRNWRKIATYCALSSICFTPFLLTYIPVLRQFSGRSYQEIATMLPSFVDYVNVGKNNWLWGKMLCSTFAGLDSRPMAWELVKGVPVCLLLAFLLFLVYYIRTIRHFQLSMARDGVCKIIVDGNEAGGDGTLTILAAGLSVAIVLAWLLILKIDGFSLWWLVVKLMPGAGGIRAVYRFQHVLAFPIAIVVAIGLHQFLAYCTSHIYACAKRWACIVAVAVFSLLLLGEQLNTGSLGNYSKQQQRGMLAAVHHPPKQALIFALLPSDGLQKTPCEAQVDAMIIAQKFSLNTINGYSGQFPYDWSGIYDFNKPAYITFLGCWIERYKLENDRLYFLDTKTGSWLGAMDLHPSLQERRGALMNGPLEQTDFALVLSAEKVPAQWQRNEPRQCALRVKNNGKVAFVSAGSDFSHIGKYAILLSCRWVEAGASVQSLHGFDTRTVLPEAVKPNAEIIMSMGITAPSKSGKYWLEIEAVQELVAWFKDKGCPGLRIEVEVI